jgi:NTE family protein
MSGNKPKIGLALGGGGARGLAHIGVIKELEANGIKIDYIAGTSIGALVGGFYALEQDINWVESVALGNSWRSMISLIDPTFRQGFLAGKKVSKFIKKYLDDKTFKDCKVSLAVTATNISNGELVVLDSGSISESIRASISAPLIFRPVKIGELLLVDGGLSLQVPVSVVKEMGADVVIAVNLDSDHFHEDESVGYGWYRIAHTTINMLFRNLAEANVENADVIINPKVGHIAWGRFDNAKEAIERGEEAVREKIKDILKTTTA